MLRIWASVTILAVVSTSVRAQGTQWPVLQIGTTHRSFADMLIVVLVNLFVLRVHHAVLNMVTAGTML